MVPYLKLKEGQSLEVTEKFLDSIQGDYRFDVTVSSALSEMPEIGRNMAFYTLPILVPMDQYYEIIQNFGEDRAVYNYRTYMNLLVEDGLMPKYRRRQSRSVVLIWGRVISIPPARHSALWTENG